MKIDERDTMFARMSYREGTNQYEDYYKRNPDKKENDDHIRTLPDLMGEGTMAYHPINAKLPDAVFQLLGDINGFSEGQAASEKVETNPEEMTRKIKNIARHFGAKDVGICEMKEDFYYSYRGRQSDSYGDKVDTSHKYAISFIVEMDKDMINRAPMLEEVIEVSKGYLDAGIIGLVISYFLRGLGYESRNHMDGNYLLVAPLVAEHAGLGQIGRMGILNTKEFGPRIRIGVVTTDLELIADEEDDYGFSEFCEMCAKCVRTCPSKAIQATKRENIDGVLRWKIDQEKCYERWRSLGTDCGVCLSSCPFSQGVDIEKINTMKNNPEVMKSILREHEDKYGIRNFNNKPMEIVK